MASGDTFVQLQGWPAQHAQNSPRSHLPAARLKLSCNSSNRLEHRMSGRTVSASPGGSAARAAACMVRVEMRSARWSRPCRRGCRRAPAAHVLPGVAVVAAAPLADAKCITDETPKQRLQQRQPPPLHRRH
eukprot:364915-Chlamydomonas_euryale.AAC.14